LLFSYDSHNDRITKEFKPSGGNPLITYYIRDAKGNIITIYTKQTIGTSLSYALTEKEIYGSNRIGSENTQIEMIGAIPFSRIDTFNRYLGFKHYELTNHLGNVLSIVSDRKIPIPNGSLIDHYEPDVISGNDYYAFGMLMSGRNFNSSSFRFGFNNRLKDDETYGNANEYDYNNRLFDPRVGRFMSIDPLYKEFPWVTPYAYCENRPIDGIDMEGLEFVSYDDKYKYKPVNSVDDAAGNTMGFLYNLYADCYNSAAAIVNVSTSVAVNTTQNGVANTAQKVESKAVQAGKAIVNTAINSWNYTLNAPAEQQLNDIYNTATDLNNWELPAVYLLSDGMSFFEDETPMLSKGVDAKNAATAGSTATKIEFGGITEHDIGHIFSDSHVQEGIYQLGTKADILNTVDKIVKQGVSAGLEDGTTTLVDNVNGHDVSVRVFVQDGAVKSVDAFKGVSKREGKLIDFRGGGILKSEKAAATPTQTTPTQTK
jgi:RHS repeat-associated protein